MLLTQKKKNCSKSEKLINSFFEKMRISRIFVTLFRALSSVGPERFLDTEEVTDSNSVGPTNPCIAWVFLFYR